MKRRHAVFGIAGGALVAVLLLPAPSASAQPQGQRRAEPPMRRQGLPAAEIERLFDGYVIMQAQESVQLTDAQFPQFIARLKALQEIRRRNQQAHRALVADLGRALSATPVPEPEVRETLRKLRELQARTADEVQKAYEGIDQVLDVVQQARFRVFEESVERRKLDLVLRARGRAAQRNAPGADR